MYDKTDLLFHIDRARRQGRWLYCAYEGLWLSPDELTACINEGKFLWDKVNWEIRDPMENVAYLRKQIAKLEAELEEFIQRVELPRACVVGNHYTNDGNGREFDFCPDCGSRLSRS